MATAAKRHPPWPCYEQYWVDRAHDNPPLAIVLILLGIAVPRLAPAVSTGALVAAAVGVTLAWKSPRVLLRIRNRTERRRWRKTVGSVVSWRQLHTLTKTNPADWVILGDVMDRARGWSVETVGGWDSVLLYHRRTGERHAVRETCRDAALEKATNWGIQTHVSEVREIRKLR